MREIRAAGPKMFHRKLAAPIGAINALRLRPPSHASHPFLRPIFKGRQRADLTLTAPTDVWPLFAHSGRPESKLSGQAER
jgi:hypothetical protein